MFIHYTFLNILPHRRASWSDEWQYRNTKFTFDRIWLPFCQGWDHQEEVDVCFVFVVFLFVCFLNSFVVIVCFCLLLCFYCFFVLTWGWPRVNVHDLSWIGRGRDHQAVDWDVSGKHPRHYEIPDIRKELLWSCLRCTAELPRIVPSS